MLKSGKSVHRYTYFTRVHRETHFTRAHLSNLPNASAHCLHDYIYIIPILLFWDLSTLCVGNHLWPLISCSLLSLLSTLWLIGTSNVYPTVHRVPTCMSCHKPIVVIIGRAHYFHDYMYIMPILLLWDLSTLYVVDHLWALILCSLLSLLSTLWFFSTIIV